MYFVQEDTATLIQDSAERLSDDMYLEILEDPDDQHQTEVCYQHLRLF